MKAIQTLYNGIRYRSRLEARWAVFFDIAGIEFEYEPEGYVLGSGLCYLPDFFLPGVTFRGREVGIWAEVKGVMSGDDEEKVTQLAMESKRCVALLKGRCSNEWEDRHEQYAPSDEGLWWDNYMAFFKCEKCGAVKFEFCEGNYMNCRECDGTSTPEHRTLQVAAIAAKAERFSS